MAIDLSLLALYDGLRPKLIILMQDQANLLVIGLIGARM